MPIISDGPEPDWRDAAAYAYLKSVCRQGFTWEWLRRGPAYRALPGEPSSIEKKGALAILRSGSGQDVRRWGLLFRRSR